MSAVNVSVGQPGVNMTGLPSATDVIVGTGGSITYVFRAREAATLTRLGVRHTALTGTTGVYRISLQGVTAGGAADGTVKGGGTPASATFSPSSLSWANASWHWVTLSNSYACTRGELLAIVIEPSSGVDGSNYSSFTTRWGWESTTGFPYVIESPAGTPTKAAGTPLCYGYGSSTTAYGRPGMKAYEPTISSSAGTEVATRFNLPTTYVQTYQVASYKIAMQVTSGPVLTAKLYGTDGTTVLQTATVDTTATPSTYRFVDFVFPDTTLATLNAGSTYRIGVTTSTAGSQYTEGMETDAAADWEPFPFGQWISTSTRTGAGAWTDSTVRRLFCELRVVDQTSPGGTYTAASNVRAGTDRGDGVTGTCAVPTAAQTLSGVSVDATTGTVVLPGVGYVQKDITFGPSSTLVGTLVTTGITRGDLQAELDTRSVTAIVMGRIDAAISTRSTYAGGAVASVTGAVGSVTGAVGSVTAPVTVGGYSTGQDPASAFNAVATDHNVAGSIGEKINSIGSITDGAITQLSIATGTVFDANITQINGAAATTVGTVPATIDPTQTLDAPRLLDGVPDNEITVTDALWCAVSVGAGRETVVGTAYTKKTPVGTTIRNLTLDSATAPTSRT